MRIDTRLGEYREVLINAFVKRAPFWPFDPSPQFLENLVFWDETLCNHFKGHQSNKYHILGCEFENSSTKVMANCTHKNFVVNSRNGLLSFIK